MHITMDATAAEPQKTELVTPSSSETRSQTMANPSLEDLQHLMLSLLQKMDQRLSLIEDHLVPSVKDQKDAKATGVTQFSDLPLEIRLDIWELAIPRRKLRPLPGDSPKPLYREPNSYGPPVIAGVCQESRAVALKRGGMYLLHSEDHTDDDECHVGWWTWFDGAHDLLDLHAACLPGKPWMPKGLMEILEQAESIIVPIKDMDSQWLSFMMRNKKVRQNLRTIYLERTHSEQAHKLRWHPRAMGTLFMESKFFLLDLENTEEVERYLALISSNPRNQKTKFDDWLDRYTEVNGMLKPPKYSTIWAKDQIAAAWGVKENNQSNLHSYFSSKRASKSKGDDRELQEQWARKMPDVLPVYVVEENKAECSCAIHGGGAGPGYQPEWETDSETEDEDSSDSDE